MGPDGFAMLVATIVWIIITGGLAYIWGIHRVCRDARLVTTTPGENDGPIVVLGVCLAPDGPAPDFIARLERARRCLGRPIVVLGGRTSRHDPRSEAEVGRDWLAAHGVPPEQVALEDASRNTLENLRALRDQGYGPAARPVLITNRYHVARVGMMADGLGLRHTLCAAEERLPLGPSAIGKLALEAFFLTWYVTGRWIARRLRHDGMLRRIG